MIKRAQYILMTGLVFLMMPLSCNQVERNKKEVALAMKKYDRLIERMNTDSIALLYTADGDLGDVAHGRDSIRRFLDSFKSYKVLHQQSFSDSVNTLTHEHAIQLGTYEQTTITPQHDTIQVKGKFKATWVWSQGGWHIKRMETKPIQ